VGPLAHLVEEVPVADLHTVDRDGGGDVGGAARGHDEHERTDEQGEEAARHGSRH
jgi:hypothetical protein